MYALLFTNFREDYRVNFIEYSEESELEITLDHFSYLISSSFKLSN